ncbi:hypothetical protein IGI04_029752, partial [Brassica rapa subsp. trilocularis]
KSTREGWDKLPKKGGMNYPGKGGKKGNAAAGKNRGAGKIESRRVLAGRGRNTLQRRSEPEELGGGPTRAGDFTGSSKKRGGIVRLSCVADRLHRSSVVTRRFSFRIEPTISGNVDGKEGNAPETHGTRNGTHGDVGKIDMCVLNPASRNPGWKWEGAGVSISFSLPYFDDSQYVMQFRQEQDKAQRDLESIREVYTLLKEFSFFYIKANKYGCLQDAHFCCCIYFSVFCSTIPQKWRFILSGDHKRDIVSKVVEFFLEINTVRIHQIDIYGSCRAPKTLGIITTVYLRCLAPR